MSLDVYIIYPKKRLQNYFLDHPYIYDHLSEADKRNYQEEDSWEENVTHNLTKMAMQIPVRLESGEMTTLYQVVWEPEEVGIRTTTALLPPLVSGIIYMIQRRQELTPYNPSNGWGSYEGFLKFLLDYKQACEDNPGCEIRVSG